VSAVEYRDDHCRVCGCMKAIEVRSPYANTTMYMTPFEFRNEATPMRPPVLRVFCSGCGLIYHEDSVK
jgi:hypothetical protein